MTAAPQTRSGQEAREQRAAEDFVHAAADLPPAVLAEGTTVLKALAAEPALREAFAGTSSLRHLFAVPAARYVVGQDRPAMWQRLQVLAGKEYRVGIEYVGEEVDDPAEIEHIVQEYLALIEESGDPGNPPPQLGFDLSNVGLLISAELAAANTARILTAAQQHRLPVMISMERSSFVDRVLGVFDQLAPEHPNVAIVLQAHLHRTPDDVARVAAHGRKVRLVKGVYREQPEVALPRSPELNERYADLAEALLGHGVPLACATQDQATLELLDRRGITGRLQEVEMLHGVRPGLLRSYRERGVPARVAAVYGENWWLHFLHRLAEYPPNVLTALGDLAEPGRVRFGAGY